jgi:hypothetical protein
LVVEASCDKASRGAAPARINASTHPADAHPNRIFTEDSRFNLKPSDFKNGGAAYLLVFVRPKLFAAKGKSPTEPAFKIILYGRMECQFPLG